MQFQDLIYLVILNLIIVFYIFQQLIIQLKLIIMKMMYYVLIYLQKHIIDYQDSFQF